jgi:hypothetical protein
MIPTNARSSPAPVHPVAQFLDPQLNKSKLSCTLPISSSSRELPHCYSSCSTNTRASICLLIKRSSPVKLQRSLILVWNRRHAAILLAALLLSSKNRLLITAFTTPERMSTRMAIHCNSSHSKPLALHLLQASAKLVHL